MDEIFKILREIAVSGGLGALLGVLLGYRLSLASAKRNLMNADMSIQFEMGNNDKILRAILALKSEADLAHSGRGHAVDWFKDQGNRRKLRLEYGRFSTRIYDANLNLVCSMKDSVRYHQKYNYFKNIDRAADLLNLNGGDWGAVELDTFISAIKSSFESESKEATCA